MEEISKLRIHEKTYNIKDKTSRKNIDNLNTNLTESNKRIDDLNTNLINSNKRIDNLNNDLTKSNERIDDLNTNLINSNKRIDNLENKEITTGDGNVTVDTIPVGATTLFAKTDSLPIGLYIVELDIAYVSGDNFNYKVFLDTTPRSINDNTLYTNNNTGGQRTLIGIYNLTTPASIEASVYNYVDTAQKLDARYTRIRYIKLK